MLRRVIYVAIGLRANYRNKDSTEAVAAQFEREGGGEKVKENHGVE